MHLQKLSASLFAALLFALPAHAQTGSCAFTINQAESNFSFSGTTSLGTIVGNPSGFQLTGSLVVDLAKEGNPVSTAKLVSGDALVVGGLHAFVPNPLPFLPPLATIDINNVRLSPSSNPFLGTVGGPFTTDVVVTALSGIADIVPLVGTPSTVDLTGTSSLPTISMGVVRQEGSNLRFRVPVDLIIDVSDPDTGVTGQINLIGTLVADHNLNSNCSTSLFATRDPISLATGGTSDFFLDAGPSRAGHYYWLLGGASGTSPGIPIGSIVLPINFDAITNLTVKQPGAPYFKNKLRGFLDGSGQSTSGLILNPIDDPSLYGLEIQFAYFLGVDLNSIDFASNPISVILAP